MKPSTDIAPAVVDFDRIRQDFPVLSETVNGHPLSYLDNAASSQMPKQVADRLDHYHRHEHANVHRGIHTLSQNATSAYEQTRREVREFINAERESGIIFTTGTTDSINLVAESFGRLHFSEGDEILLSEMEHHANIVPWQMIADKTGAKVKVIPVDDSGDIIMDVYLSMLNEKTKMVAVAHVSNALGTVNPVKEIVTHAHDNGSAVLIDGAQAVPHGPVDVRDLDCDFYAFSSHKMCGPTGFGILYGKREHLESMAPYRGGGDMIDRVTFDRTTYNVCPYKFEAGTPPISAGIGLGEAIRYLNTIGMEQIAIREEQLVNLALKRMQDVEGVQIFGMPRNRASVIAFNLEGIHSQDVGTLLDKQGVAIRTGHHCAQPILSRYGETATARVSLSFYNNEADINRLISGLEYVKKFFT